jgi:CheY-like chemotaxis protein
VINKTPKRILVVDDNEDHLVITKSRLELQNSSFVVLTARSGEECLSVLENKEFDCIISDYEMRPGMSGMELLMEIKARDYVVPFIVLTDYGNPQLERDAYMHGAEAYFTKSSGDVNFIHIADSIRMAVAKQRLLNKTQPANILHINGEAEAAEIKRATILEELRELLNRLPYVGMLLSQDATTLMNLNPAAEAFFGKNAESQRTQFSRMLLKIFNGRQPSEVVSLVGAGGRVQPFAVSGTGYSYKGKMIGILIAARPLAHQ